MAFYGPSGCTHGSAVSLSRNGGLLVHVPFHLLCLSMMTKTPSVEPVLPSRLLPRISSRWLFVLTLLAAVIAAVARVAGQGSAVAFSVMVALAYLAIIFLLFSLLFFLVRGVSLIWYAPPSEAHDGSPFAADQLPPQILPPRESKE